MLQTATLTLPSKLLSPREQTLITIPLVAATGLASANPLHVMIAAKGVSPMHLGQAAADAGPAAASGFSDGQPKPKMRRLCKNIQKAWAPIKASLAVTAPVSEGGVTHIQISTTSRASHKFTLLPLSRFAPVPGGPRAEDRPFLYAPTMRWRLDRGMDVPSPLFLPGAFPGPQLPQVWSHSSQKYDKFDQGLDEVNPLEGLLARRRALQTPFPLPPYPPPRSVPRHAGKNFPSRPLHPPAVGPYSTTPIPTTRATRCNSCHPTPFDVFCFCVRMVACLAFVSYLTIPIPTTFDDALPAGHVERVVILCAELEHPGQAPEGSSVKAIDVTVRGAGGARVRLLPRDYKSFPELFALRLSAHEQYHLFALRR
ncbi:hypothetical protein EDB85DRAFT_2163205 [Lactarius pseudohatsudake]|nr:hypothetical protein EDB85DRAFT_2163205 [Lactarius pseudohatsudake]